MEQQNSLIETSEIINILDSLVNMKRNVPQPIKTLFNKDIVGDFLKEKGITNVNLYYDKMLRIIHNVLISKVQTGGAGHRNDMLVTFQGNMNANNRIRYIKLMLSIGWLVICFTSLIAGIYELIELTDYEILSNRVDNTRNIQSTMTGELVVYDDQNTGIIVPIDELSTLSNNVAVRPSPHEIREVLTLGQFLTLKPEVGQILMRKVNTVMTDVMQNKMNEIYDRVRSNYEQTSARAMDVVNPNVLFSEDPVGWLSVGVGGLMNYLRYETNEETVRLKEELDDALLDAARELEDFRISLTRHTHSQLRFIIRRLEIVIQLIQFGGGGLLVSALEYIRRRRMRNSYSTDMLSIEDLDGGKKKKRKKRKTRRRKTKKTKRRKRKTKRRKNKKKSMKKH